MNFDKNLLRKIIFCLNTANVGTFLPLGRKVRTGLRPVLMRHSLLLDAGALTAPVTLEIQLGPANAANLVQFHGLDIGGVQRERPFHTYAVGDLPYSESGCLAFALTFDHFTLEALDTLFVPFNDLIVDSDVITGLEGGELSFSRQLLVYKSYSSVHKTKFCDASASFKRIAKLARSGLKSKFISPR